MWNQFGGFPGSTGTVTINFIPQHVPQCGSCGNPATVRANDGHLFCAAHWDVERRRMENDMCMNGMAWLFRVVKPESRKKLYRALASVVHPDAGGSHELMTALNAVAEAHGA
jgi:hypothetical protein